MDEVMWLLKEKRVRYGDMVAHFEKELQKLPTGCPVLKRVNGTTYCYHQYWNLDGKRVQRFIPEKEAVVLVPRLWQRRFAEECLKILKADIAAIDLFMKKYREFNVDAAMGKIGNAYQLYGTAESMIGRSPIITNRDVTAWLNEPYESNTLYPERKIHITLSGKRVRSKSETIIANLLDAEGIPYRYEAVLRLAGKSYYPDFTIFRVSDGKLIYWEHFGLIGDELYEQRMEEKLAIYRSHGIVPWDNLIVTYDQCDGAIDARNILWMIRSWKN